MKNRTKYLSGSTISRIWTNTRSWCRTTFANLVHNHKHTDLELTKHSYTIAVNAAKNWYRLANATTSQIDTTTPLHVQFMLTAYNTTVNKDYYQRWFVDCQVFGRQSGLRIFGNSAVPFQYARILYENTDASVTVDNRPAIDLYLNYIIGTGTTTLLIEEIHNEGFSFVNDGQLAVSTIPTGFESRQVSVYGSGVSNASNSDYSTYTSLQRSNFSANFTLADNNTYRARVLNCTGTITVTVPSINSAWSWFIIKNANVASGTITLHPSTTSVLIDGSNDDIVLRPNESIMIGSKAANAYTIVFDDRKRTALVGRSGLVNDSVKHWFLVAEATNISNYQDLYISFRVFRGNSTVQYGGILSAHVRIDATKGVVSSKQLQWEYKNSGFNLEDFAITHIDTSGTSVKVQIWHKNIESYGSCKFVVIAESSTTGDSLDSTKWILTRARKTEGDLETLDTGFTGVATSTLVTIDNPISGNAATATKLAASKTINIQDADSTNTGTAASFDGSANAVIKLPATIKANITGNASGTASKLAATKSIWGNNFDGSADVTGTISGAPCIEFKPTASTSNNGGYLDFHYNQSTADYTSRIIESASGTLSVNNVTVTTGKVVTATSFVGNLTGNADTATKIGTTDVGSGNNPIYLSAGVPTATGSRLNKGIDQYVAAGGYSDIVKTYQSDNSNYRSCTIRCTNGDGFNEIVLGAHNEADGAPGGISVKNTAGTITAYAPAPAADANDTRIATTKWVNDKGYLTSHQTLPTLSVSSSGSGNAVTNITVSDHAITFTKGTTFLTSHQSLAGYLPLTGGTLTGTLNGTDMSYTGTFSKKHSEITKGTNPSATKYWTVTFCDKNGTSYANNCIGMLETSITSAGVVSTYLRAMKNTAEVSTNSQITAVYDTANSLAYATCPTPAAGDNSTKIATTAWVQTFCGTTKKYLTSETKLSVSTSGSGNAVTAISVSNHAITVTKGTTFLTSHQSLSAYAKLAGATFTGTVTLQNTSIRHKNTNIAKGTDANADTSFQFNFVDKNDKVLSGIWLYYFDNKHAGCGLRAYKSNAASDTDSVAATCNYLSGGDMVFRPNKNGSVYLGYEGFKWKVLYCGDATIHTSDKRLKTDITSFTDTLLDAWENVNWVSFRFKEAIQIKGEENARIHFGLIAQDIQDVFTENDLDATRYSFFCHHSWDAEDATYDQDGNLLDEAREAGDEYAIRYAETLAIEAAYQRRKIKQLEEKNRELEERIRVLEQAILNH